MAALTCQWCSQASALQRAGRAGRVAPGTIVHLFTEGFHDASMPPFEEAEMLRLPLETTVLRVKLLLSGFGAPTELLAQSLSPPPPGRIADAVRNLYELGALLDADEHSAVTFLGRLATGMPVDLPLVRLILLGIEFECAADAVVIAAALSLQDVFLMPSSLFIRKVPQYAAELAANLQARAHFDHGGYSEPLSFLAAYKAWLLSSRSLPSARALGLSHSRAVHLDSLVADLAERAVSAAAGGSQSHQLERLRSCARKRGRCKADDLDGVFSRDEELLRFVLACACAPNFMVGECKKGSTSAKGYAPNRTVQIHQLASELCSETALRAALGSVCLKVSKCKLDGKKAWVELEETPKLEGEGPSAPGQQAGAPDPVHASDACMAIKLLGQLQASYRRRLCLPNPNCCPGSDAPPEVMLGNVLLGPQVGWRMEGDKALGKVFTYWRSPLGTLCSHRDDAGCIHGVAHTILGGEACVYAEGITLFRTAHYGKVMQFTFPKRSSALKLEVRAVRSPSGGVAAWSVTSFRADGAKPVSFEPQSLDAQDLECVNRVRRLANQVLELGPQGLAAQVHEARFRIQQLLQRPPPPSPAQQGPADKVWVKFPRLESESYAFLPLMDTALLSALVEAALRRERPKADGGSTDDDSDVGTSADSSPESDDGRIAVAPPSARISADPAQEASADAHRHTTLDKPLEKGLSATASSASVQRLSAAGAAGAGAPTAGAGPISGSVAVAPKPKAKKAAVNDPGVSQADREATVRALVEHTQALMRSSKGKRVVRLTQVNKMVRSAKSKGGQDLLAMVRRLGGRVRGLGPEGIVSGEFFTANPTPFECRTEFGQEVVCFKAVAGAGPAAGGTRPCPALDSSPTPQTPTPAPGYDALVRLVRDVLLAAAGPGGQNAPTDLTRLNVRLMPALSGAAPPAREAAALLRTVASGAASVAGIHRSGALSREFFDAQPSLFVCHTQGDRISISLRPDGPCSAAADVAAQPAQPTEPGPPPPVRSTAPPPASTSKAQPPPPPLHRDTLQSALPQQTGGGAAGAVDELVRRVRALVLQEVERQPCGAGVDVTRINILIGQAGGDLRAGLAALHRAGVEGVGKGGTVRKEFFLSHPSAFSYHAGKIPRVVPLPPGGPPAPPN